jgi:hypothetical protein
LPRREEPFEKSIFEKNIRMLKKIVLIAVVIAVALTGYFIWKSYSGSCCADSCAITHSYSMKMSMICEQSCAAEGIDKSKAVAQSMAKAGDYTQCPVSGVVFKINEGNTKLEYGEKMAYTCCETCAGIFNEKPADYSENIN